MHILDEIEISRNELQPMWCVCVTTYPCSVSSTKLAKCVHFLPSKCLHYQRSAILCFHLHISINTASTFNDPYNYLCSFSFFKFLCFFLNFLLLNSIDKFLLWQQDNKNIIDQNLIKIDTIQAILEVFSIYLLFHSYIINFIK